MSKILVTGATGFIGSAFARRLGNNPEHHLVLFYRSTAEKNHERLYKFCHLLDAEKNEAIEKSGTLPDVKCDLVQGDLLGDISGLCEGVDIVVNFAARTFVDHSIRDPLPFINSNVIGTARLLEDARRHNVKRFYQISTDEVYGSILQGAYTEESPVNPTNPYSATKLGADALAISYAHTFGLHTTVTRTENNYGPLQHPQKVFPAFIKKALNGEKLPIYGDGKHVRQWLWVDDHVDAILHLIGKDYSAGQVFHVAGNQELENLELARKILLAIDSLHIPSDDEYKSFEDRIEFIADHNIRPGHDRRYALDCTKLRNMGWEPKMNLDAGIQRAVQWYVENKDWWL